MRIIFTCLLLCCFNGMLHAQKDILACGLLPGYNPPATKLKPQFTLPGAITTRTPASVNEINPNSSGCAPKRFVMRCRGPLVAVNEEPLYIIDGLIAGLFEFKQLDPASIESIHILKDAGTAPIYCGRASSGVIVITTKQLTIKVTDATDRNAISGATVKLIPVEATTQIQMATVNTEGFVKLRKKFTQYEIEITSVGYEPKKIKWNADSAHKNTITVAMERQIREMEAVKIIGYVYCRGRDITSCGVSGRCRSYFTYKDQTKKNEVATSSIFPNPLPRGQVASININATKTELMQVRMLTFTGQQLFSFPAQVKEGANRFTIPAKNNLTAGMYIVQVLDHKGKPIQTDKLIIQ